MANFNPVVEWVYQRIKKNKNAIITINGPTGSGKTYTGLDIAIQGAARQGTRFTIKNNMAFTFKDLLKLTMLPENQHPGVYYLYEEPGAVGSGSSAKEWQSRANALANSFMQTNRCKNQVLILTHPLFSNLDLGSRKLIHMQITMLGINPQKKESYSRPFLLQVNTTTGKIYFKLMRFSVNGVKSKLKVYTSKLPDKAILEEYEAVKSKYVNSLNKRILEELEHKDQKDKVSKTNLTRPGNIPKVDVDVLQGLIAKGFTSRQCAAKIGCSKALIDYYRQNKLNKTAKIDHNKEVLTDV